MFAERTFAEKTLAEGMLAERMFADSVLETSWGQRSRRSWSTLTSFGLQAVAGGLLLLLPMLRTVGLPAYRALSTPVSFGRPAPEPSAPQLRRGGETVLRNGSSIIHVISQPDHIPITVATGADEGPQLPSGDIGNGIYNSSHDGSLTGLWSGPGGTMAVMPKAPPAPAVRAIRTSSMLQGNLIRRVEPAYPPLARSARIEGSVELAAIISKEGAIENLRLVSGHPLLVHAALDAVRQWRYRPYILNGEPVEVETQITVRFFLRGN
jgi:periplasmic protein TonB